MKPMNESIYDLLPALVELTGTARSAGLQAQTAAAQLYIDDIPPADLKVIVGY